MFELQEYIYTEIHKKYYYSFLCSEQYCELKEQISSERTTINSLIATHQRAGTGEADDGNMHKQKLKALKKNLKRWLQYYQNHLLALNKEKSCWRRMRTPMIVSLCQ